jgi:hypothetical protein
VYNTLHVPFAPRSTEEELNDDETSRPRSFASGSLAKRVSHRPLFSIAFASTSTQNASSSAV